MNQPNQIKRSIRAFTRTMEAEQETWPDDLRTLGHHFADALRMLDVPNPAEIAIRLAAKDEAAFRERYAAHMARQGE